jgi:DNA-binding XRE family transcriptional regulator
VFSIIKTSTNHTNHKQGGDTTKFKIREVRERKGFSQVELANRSGVSRATICALESGWKDVTTTRTLKKIADAMGVAAEDLFTDDRTA